MGLLQDFLAEVKKKGGRGETRLVRSEVVNVATTGTLLGRASHRRTLLVLSHVGTGNFVKVAKDMNPQSSAGVGVPLGLRETIVIDRDTEGEACTKEVWAAADTAAVDISVEEHEAY